MGSAGRANGQKTLPAFCLTGLLFQNFSTRQVLCKSMIAVRPDPKQNEHELCTLLSVSRSHLEFRNVSALVATVSIKRARGSAARMLI